MKLTTHLESFLRKPFASHYGRLSAIGAVILSVISILFTLLPGNSVVISETSRLLGGTDLTDSIGHIVLMGMLSAAWYGCLLKFYRQSRAIAAALLITLLLGTITELLQNLIPERGESWIDLLANWAGPLTFALWFYVRLKPNAESNRILQRPFR